MLRTEPGARTAAPVTLFTTSVAAHSSKATTLRDAGCEVVALPASSAGGLDLGAALRHLAAVHHAANVLIESGPGLLGRMIAAGLVDEAMVFVAPKLLGDPAGLSPAAVGEAASISRAVAVRPARVRRLGDDIVILSRFTS